MGILKVEGNSETHRGPVCVRLRATMQVQHGSRLVSCQHQTAQGLACWQQTNNNNTVEGSTIKGCAINLQTRHDRFSETVWPIQSAAAIFTASACQSCFNCTFTKLSPTNLDVGACWLLAVWVCINQDGEVLKAKVRLQHLVHFMHIIHAAIELMPGDRGATATAVAVR